MSGSTRYLGLGLAGLGILLGLMCSVWSLTQPSALGGRLFALMAAAIVVAPLLIAGFILYRRGQREEVETAGFDAARRTLDRRRLASGDWARRLEALAGQTGRGAAAGDRAGREATTRLTMLAEALREAPDEAAALSVLAAERPETRADLDAADSSFEAEVARLESRAAALAADPAALLEAVDRLNRVFNQRQRLLARGTLPPVPSVAELMAPRQSLGPGSVDLAALAIGDAVSYPGRDFLVVGRVDYEEAGYSWLAYRLRDGRRDALLLLDGGKQYLLDADPTADVARAVGTGARELTADGAAYRLSRSGSATATVSGAAGRRPGVIVDFRRYDTAPDAQPLPTLVWAERFDEPSATWTVWRGEAVSPSDLDVFPRARGGTPGTA